MSAEHETGGTEATDEESAAVLSILFAPGVGDAVRALRAYGDRRVAEFASWRPADPALAAALEKALAALRSGSDEDAGGAILDGNVALRAAGRLP